MAKPAYAREAAQVKTAHPDLDDATARRVAETYVQVSRDSGTPLPELLAESVRAENSSAAGNQTGA
jgi:hypothetical protein